MDDKRLIIVGIIIGMIIALISIEILLASEISSGTLYLGGIYYSPFPSNQVLNATYGTLTLNGTNVAAGTIIRVVKAKPVFEPENVTIIGNVIASIKINIKNTNPNSIIIPISVNSVITASCSPNTDNCMIIPPINCQSITQNSSGIYCIKK